MWIQNARTMSVRDLDAAIRDATAGGSSHRGEPTALAFRRRDSDRDAHDSSEKDVCDGGRVESPVVESGGRRVEPSVLFRVHLPPEARLALNEVADLHRSTTGHDATRTCFIEDLLAEVAASGLWAPDPDRSSTGRFPRVRDGAHGAKQRPKGRPEPDAPPLHSTEGRLATRLLASFARDLRELARVTREVPSGGSIRRTRAIARILRRLMQQENEIAVRMGGLLLEQHERRGWATFGCTGVEEYAEQLGWDGVSARRRVGVARALRRHAIVRRAYESGHITLARTEWIVRETRLMSLSESAQKRWITHAAPLQSKRLHEESRLLERQRLEHRAATARAVTLRWRSAAKDATAQDSETGATRDADMACDTYTTRIAGARTKCFPVPPDDETWLRSVSRVPGQARHRLLDLEGALLERVLMRGAMLEECLVFSIPESLANDLHDCLTRMCQRLRQEVVQVRSAAEDARTLLSVRIAAAFVGRGAHVPLWVGLMAAFEICVLEWDEPRRGGWGRSLQRRVLERDGYRCTAPGCTARRNLQVNHVHERSRGGPDAIWNLHTVCATHHLQFIHGGRASVHGQAPGRLTWRIGRPEVAQWFANERRIRSAI